MQRAKEVRIIFLFIGFWLLLSAMHGQESLTYLLSNDLLEKDEDHVKLVVLTNEADESGYFDEFVVPISTCPSSFAVDGYHYADNAGLRFENDGFITCEYTVQFTFHIKDMMGPEGWVRLLNFTPSDDNGIYIKLTDAPTAGTLEFWPNGLVGEDDFFNTVDLYQFVITRDCSGEVNIYVNGAFFATYDDSSAPLYLVNSSDDIIDFFQDDTQVRNEASPGWVKNIIISNFPLPEIDIEEEWAMFCETLQATDCNGTVNGKAVLDDCGVCLEVNDPTFNESCVDCAGVVAGNSVVDECGICLEMSDANFNKSCADCAGLPNGTSVIDDCGVCLEVNDPIFNKSCLDCAGVMNGTSLLDECGICLEANDPDFNKSCSDCAGVPNGTAVMDDCGECLLPSAPSFNESCADCAGIPNGPAVLDECGVCLEASDPLFNQSCLDCAGVVNGTFVVDECNVCLEANDPDFNRSCITEFYFPTAFSPNQDGRNDRFEVFKSADTDVSIQVYRIFNRWGELIYSAENFGFGEESNFWDGYHAGSLVSPGSFMYYVEAVFPNGTVRKYSGLLLVAK